MVYRTEVYMIRHNVTGRMYIGRSQDVPKRTYQHFQKLRNGKHPVEDMQKDFDEYGDNFSVSIIGEIDNSHLNLEIETMEKYGSTVRGIGYNYKDPHITNAIRNAQKPRSPKAQICNLVKTLETSQAETAYKVLSIIFSCGRPIKTEYLTAIVEALNNTEDIELLDFVLQLINKSNKGI